MSKKNITFADIAKYTNFSKTTISRYFNNPSSLTPENQKVIADALVTLNYKENKVARILAKGKTEFIGIIIPNLYFHYYAQILNELLSTYETSGYKFLVFTSHSDAEKERKYLQELLSYKIEGLLVLSHCLSSRELASYNIPVVTIEREDYYTCSVNVDNYAGAVQATELLIKNNCDILFHLNSEINKSMPSHERIQAFADTSLKANIPYKLLLQTWGDSYEEQLQALTSAFEDFEKHYHGKRKGIFFSNDTMANVFLNLIIRKYGTLPDDYRIVGFDGAPISNEAVIPISTVQQPVDLIAREAMDLLIMQIENHKKGTADSLLKPIHKLISPVLLKRNTTLPVLSSNSSESESF